MADDFLVSGNMYLSSAIPKVFCNVGEDYSYPTVVIDVYVERKDILSSSVYVIPELHGVEIRIADLIHSYMRNNKLICADIQIDFTTPEGSGIDTVYAKTIFSYTSFFGSAGDWTAYNFLSNIDAMLVPEWYRGTFALYNPLEENENMQIWVTPKGKQPVLADDERFATPGLNMFTFDITEIKQRGIDNRVLEESDIPAIVRIVCGCRCLSLYVKDEIPSASITFRNSFNAVQTVYFFGSWKQKLSSEAKTAVVDGNLTPFDMTVESSYEILSHPLSAADMLYYQLIGLSPAVSAVLFLNRNALIVDGVLTDTNAETAPHQEDMEQLKLTLKPKTSDGIITLNISDYRIFNDIFNKSFI
jgi:hypothetical protein